MPQLIIGNRQSAMAALNDRPRSSSKKQHQTLVLAALKHGLDVHEVRRLVGGSLRALSAKDCSDWIKHFSGRNLPNPPGGKPWPYKPRAHRRHPECSEGPTSSLRPGACPERVPSSHQRIPRMIQQDHIEQIGRLMLRYFGGNIAAASVWFLKTWKVKDPRDLETTARAGEVIRVLKEMVERKEGTL